MISILVGISKAALAMARLIIDGEDRRPRLFIVPICNKRDMFDGVESLRFGPRHHSRTRFLYYAFQLCPQFTCLVKHL
ncbi:hypothetical protein EDD22DRAFT_791007 [Suillus occidentalis]|nr:hypothetical protein EDD22DRAFT_791007 [Suillus occidentalis]